MTRHPSVIAEEFAVADGGRVVWLSVDNPGKINILDSRLCAALPARLDAAQGRTATRQALQQLRRLPS